MSSRRVRRAESDRGRSPAQAQQQVEPNVQALMKQISDVVIQRLDIKYAEKWPKEYDQYLACPFRRRNPDRYAHVLDYACTGHGFKNIADLRDHIKRVHSDKYGCSECKERYQCRDNSFAATEKKHKDECKQGAKGLLDVSHFKPEWMTPEEDRRYFKLDFRRMSGLNAEEQYFKICEAIWPGFSSRGLNIWSKPGDTVAKCHLAEVLQDPDLLAQFLGPLAEIAASRHGAGAGTGIQLLDGRHDQMSDFYSTETAQLMMFNGGTHNSNNGMFVPDFSDQSQWTYADSTQDELHQLGRIALPEVYTDKGTKDSAYESYETEDDRLMIEPPMSTSIFDGEYNYLSDLAVRGELQRELYLVDEFNDLDIHMGVDA
ncbi:hypothetical protein QBC33DRAFT_253387 [Phialemonium atrogriseum]|uniref:C2H2-type domain-containing protein n=1 Tax=Phialemonium atrogriseum TaxID=1093897 RepID=A0AAJ0BR16_9PEZI|nr:uncharacterized protein QBC33DRAFT_253387 [Phialemonium atrogriseum]KAK1762893.1 hypothetical protein QBC33DRAFT_253387 [Phialemonium atrogriseum]